jgi:hypothetical protein
MRFSIQPEPRQEQNMRTVTIEEIVAICENDSGPKTASFIKEFLHYLNSGLLEAKHRNLDQGQYIAFVLSFQFTAPLLEISTEKELGISIMAWQREQNIPQLAEAFGRSIVIPSFFSFFDKKLANFYRQTTGGITYRVAVPEQFT